MRTYNTYDPKKTAKKGAISLGVTSGAGALTLLISWVIVKEFPDYKDQQALIVAAATPIVTAAYAVCANYIKKGI